MILLAGATQQPPLGPRCRRRSLGEGDPSGNYSVGPGDRSNTCPGLDPALINPTAGAGANDHQRIFFVGLEPDRFAKDPKQTGDPVFPNAGIAYLAKKITMKKLLLLSGLALMGTTLLAQATNYPNGSTVADFTVTDIEGNTFSLYDITAQGKYVVLDFFFSTCGPCQATAPYFNQLHETYGCNAHDLYCLTVNNGMDNNAAVEAYEAAHGGPYSHSPAVSNEGGGEAVNDAFGVGAFPTYCLIGPDNVMKVNDMWPISSMADFVAFFPAGTGIEPAACVTAIAENPASHRISAQPTPSTGRITFDMAGMAPGTATMRIFDMLGQPVFNSMVQVDGNGAAHRIMDLGALADGQYLCSFIMADGKRNIQRIVIAH